MAVTRTTGRSSPPATAAIGRASCDSAGTVMPAAPGGICGPSAPKTVSCTLAVTAPGLDSSRMSEEPVVVVPPTIHDSSSGGRHAAAAKPTRSGASTSAEDAADSTATSFSTGAATKKGTSGAAVDLRRGEFSIGRLRVPPPARPP